MVIRHFRPYHVLFADLGEPGSRELHDLLPASPLLNVTRELRRCEIQD